MQYNSFEILDINLFPSPLLRRLNRTRSPHDGGGVSPTPKVTHIPFAERIGDRSRLRKSEDSGIAWESRKGAQLHTASRTFFLFLFFSLPLLIVTAAAAVGVTASRIMDSLHPVGRFRSTDEERQLHDGSMACSTAGCHSAESCPIQLVVTCHRSVHRAYLFGRAGALFFFSFVQNAFERIHFPMFLFLGR